MAIGRQPGMLCFQRRAPMRRLNKSGDFRVWHEPDLVDLPNEVRSWG